MIKAFSGPGFFRLLLALIVIVDHSTRVQLGTASVFVFFVLSGYWITTMWNTRYSKAVHPYLVYLGSRAWRLMPVFILCSAIAWIQLYVSGTIPPNLNWPSQIASNIFLLGYYMLPFQANGPAWSLDIEAQFYLVAPLLIVFMSRPTWTIATCAAVSIAACVLGMTHNLGAFIFFFAIGMASAVSGWSPAPRLAWGSLIAAGLLLIICLATPLRGFIVGGTHKSALYEYTVYAEVFFASLVAPWAIYTTRQVGIRLDSMFGDLSYIVYLLHMPVLLAFHYGEGSYAHRGAMTLAAVFCILAGSWLIWRFFDHPINRLRSKWVAAQLVNRAANAPAVA